MNSGTYASYLSYWATLTPEKIFLRTSSEAVTYSSAAKLVDSKAISRESFSKSNSVNSVLSWLANDSEADGVAHELVNSSGSTGDPKSFLISRPAQMITSHFINTEILENEKLDELIILPLSHSNARGRLKAALIRGATLHLHGLPFSAKNMKSTLNQFSNLATSMTPTTYRQLRLLAGDGTGEFLSQLRNIEFGSATLYPHENNELASTIHENTKLKMHYGLTEASRSFLRDIRTTAHNELGEPGEHVSFRIESDGELVLSGSHSADYKLHSSGEKESITEIMTGDLIEQLPEGQLTWLGRKGNVANVGGIKCFPEAIESAMISQYQLDFVSIVSVPDPILEEHLVLFISPKNLAEKGRRLLADKDEFRGADLIQIDSLPLLNSGKVDRQKLRRLAISKHSGGKNV